MKIQEQAKIVENGNLQDDYWQVVLKTPRIAPLIAPGQFVHVRMPALKHRILRRPFSVFNVEGDFIHIVYKIVGEGSAHLATLEREEWVDLLGPLGNGFTLPPEDMQPIIVAGGYGAAATYLLARRSKVPTVCLIGGRTKEEVLLVEEFTRAGATVKIATEDGSEGHHGLVTELLEAELDKSTDKQLQTPVVYACGPDGMLYRVSEIVLAQGLDAEVSLDHAMCCGVGACFACVVRLKSENEQG
ncbi:MAG: dihydroorotate dehydrogenase electron transfer subunit, partial [Verrucomicrobiota bacterium]